MMRWLHCICLIVTLMAISAKLPFALAATTPSDKTDDGQNKTAMPLLLDLEPTKEIYNSRENILIKANLWAVQPVELCWYRNRPESNFTVDITRAGSGKLAGSPNVIQLRPGETMQTEKLKLEPGKMRRLVFDLKKTASYTPGIWKTGEYQAQVRFHFCPPSETESRSVTVATPLRFMIVE